MRYNVVENQRKTNKKMNASGNTPEMPQQTVAVGTHTSLHVQVGKGLLLGLSVMFLSSYLYLGFLSGFATVRVTSQQQQGDGTPLTGFEVLYRTEASNPLDWPFEQNTNTLALWSDVEDETKCVDTVADGGVYQSMVNEKVGDCGLNEVEKDPRVPLVLMEKMTFSISGNHCENCGGQAPGNGYNFTTRWSDNWITGWNSEGCAISESVFPTVCATGVGFTIQAVFDGSSPWRFRGYRTHTFDHGGTLNVRLTSRSVVNDPPPPPPGGSPTILKAPPESLDAFRCEFFGVDCDD